MTEQTSAPEAQTRHAVDTLVQRLEHEHAWASELRDDLTHTEKNIASLLASIDAALELIPREERAGYRIRCARLGQKDARMGRPPRDARNAALLHYLSERVGETVGNGELRLHLQKAGLKATAKYVHATLANWASEGIVTRVAHGCYMVAAGHPRLMAFRQPSMDSQIRDTMRAEKEARFEAQIAVETETPQSSPEEIERRRREIYGPQRCD